MKKNIKEANLSIYDIDKQESDEYFYYVLGYTSGGGPYGITWEQAMEDGLIEDKKLDDDTDELPF